MADASTDAYRCAGCGAVVAIPIMAPDDELDACGACGRTQTVAEWGREETERWAGQGQAGSLRSSNRGGRSSQPRAGTG